MKLPIRATLFAFLMLLSGIISLNAQVIQPKITKIIIKHVGPQAASDSLIRANIRLREGETFSRPAVDDDIKNLYATGFFSNIRVSEQTSPEGMELTYIVQGKPILTELKITGNKRYKTSKLLKKVTSKVGQPLDERKLFSDAQEIQKYYEKAGYQKTTAKVLPVVINEATGRGSAVIEIHEAPKVKIKDIVFDGVVLYGPEPKHEQLSASATQSKLRKELKTKRRWMFSFLTGSGVIKEDEFEDDKDRLIEFLQNEGYIDAAITDVKFDYVKPTRVIIHFVVSQGKQYKVGTVEFKGEKLYTTNDFLKGIKLDDQLLKVKMVSGKTFTPVGLTKDTDTLRDFYGAKGYIDASVWATKTPNPTSGTMDLVYDIQEGDKSYIEKIEIKGNSKTKDKVIRRELAVSPGETYDMVRVKLSKERIQNLEYFEKVDTQSEPTDVPNRKNLVLGVEEKNTGNIMLGAGFSSVDSVIGFVEVTQGNFDLFKPPTFTGAGQKFRARVQIGSERKDYEISFIEPWFLGKKLSLGVDLFYRELDYLSLNDIYNQTEGGGTVSLTRALGSDFLIGRVSYTLENVDIGINNAGFPGNHTNDVVVAGVTNLANVSHEIWDQQGSRLVSKMGTSLAFDTRSGGRLPSHGQRSELITELAGLGGDTKFYKLEARTSWYFPGFGEGHILELGARTGVVDSYGNTDTPLFDRWFLGGLYSLRGYKFRQVGPHNTAQFGSEPLGGGTYWFGCAEYSIPIVERVRFALFYDIGNVYDRPFNYSLAKSQNPVYAAQEQTRTKIYNDDIGIGLRLNLPIGPLRLDYGIPITYDQGVSASGKFQFGVGYSREF